MKRFFSRLVQQTFLLPLFLLVGAVGPTATMAAQLTLSWTETSTNVDSFKIERGPVITGPFSQIATTTVTSYTDANLAAGTTYCYRVRAHNAAGDSGYSNAACGTTAASQNFTITVTKSGTGSGTVSSNPAGINNCGTTCSSSFAQGITVTLSATPAAGSTFSGWSGGCSGTGICTIIANANTSVTATFTPTSQSYALTVTIAGTGSGTVSSNPAGINNCGTTCSASFAQGITVTLTATPATGSTFSGWSGGGCSGTSSCKVTMSAATSVTAAFTAASTSSGGLMAAYSFDENSGTLAHDASGNNNTGTLINGPLWTTGKYGRALSFNGSDSYVKLPSTLDSASLPFTIEAWVKPTNYNDYRTIVSKRNTWNASDMRFDLILYRGTGHVTIEQPNNILEFSYAPPIKTWTHLGVVVQSGSTQLYVNGTLNQTLGAFTLGSKGTAQVRIGMNADGPDVFLGTLDDIRIYNRALTASDISTDMNKRIR